MAEEVFPVFCSLMDQYPQPTNKYQRIKHLRDKTQQPYHRRHMHQQHQENKQQQHQGDKYQEYKKGKQQ